MKEGGSKRRRFSYRVIKTNGQETIHTVMMSEDPQPNEVHRAVEPHLDGASMQHVYVLNNNETNDMFVDDLAQPKCLPRNDKATNIYRAYGRTLHPDVPPESMPYIAGPAVIFQDPVWSLSRPPRKIQKYT